ncbi:hypothetical protein H4S00_000509 [Coemansia sp. D1744]|nr:hypothetical protein H4S00_000509 [Coemansia sp. D1744]
MRLWLNIINIAIVAVFTTAAASAALASTLVTETTKADFFKYLATKQQIVMCFYDDSSDESAKVFTGATLGGIIKKVLKILGGSQTTPKRTRSTEAEPEKPRYPKRHRLEDAAHVSTPNDLAESSVNQAMTNSRGSAGQLTAADARNEGSPDLNGNGSTADARDSQSPPPDTGATNGRDTAALADTSDTLLKRYPGQEQETQRICLRDSQFEEEQVVRLLLQELHDRGFTDTFNQLQRESGFTLENEPVSQFRNSVLAGEWSKVKDSLSTIGIQTPDNLNAALFLIKRQQFLELLEARQLKQALLVLQNELSTLTNDIQQLHRLSGLLMCPSVEDLRTAADWDGSSGRSRFVVLESLQTYISPGSMVPVHRMETLFGQALAYQCDACKYHVRPANQGLYIDHMCPTSVFPQELQFSLKGHQDEVWYVAFSPDGRYLASGSRDKTCIIWSMSDFSIVHRFNGHQNEVAYIAWSPNSKYIVSASSDRTLRLWDVEDGTQMQVFSGHEETVTSCKWLGTNDRFISGGLDHRIIIWDINGTIVKQISSPRVHDLAVSSDCSLLLVADEKTDIHAYDLTTLTFMYSLNEPVEVMSMALSADARYCITGLRNGELHMWDLDTRTLVRDFSGHTQGQYVIRCTFAGQDDRLVATGSEDGLLFVWNRNTGQLLARLRGHTKTINVCTWSDKAAALATSSDDKTICIWPAYRGAPSHRPDSTDDLSTSDDDDDESHADDKSMVSGAHSTTSIDMF